MDVEKTILELIPKFLKAYDPHKRGTNLDIGVGTFSFYFEIFAKAGYKTIAVEPLPSENVIRLTNKLTNTTLVTTCLLDYIGEVDFYTGVFNGNNLTDVSSVNKDWWGVSEQNSVVKKVSAITLENLINTQQVNAITFCKIDTEGSEFTIIKQFANLDTSKHPLVIEFEYGGGCSKAEQKAGWSEKYMQNTIDCIKTLYNLGYKYLLLFERENGIPLEIQLNSNQNIDTIFKDFYVYGDIFMMKEKKYNLNLADGRFVFDFENSLSHKLKRIFN